ncbi:MAG: hypothetical protein COA73_11700 [Candidatus Hydrogenedentota bacterium]|nr:MAG: hypothetical protein COA73_11700 [Candidatus Hydrogenedentota bacterium]
MNTELSEAASQAPDTVDLFRINVANATYEEFCNYLDYRIQNRLPGFIVTPNVDHVCMFHRNGRFHEAYERAFIAIPDGTPLMWSAKIFGTPLKQKLSGSDMVPALSEFAARKGYSVFFLGGHPGTAEKSAVALQEQYPGLQVAGVNCPPMGFDTDPKALQAVIDHLIKAKPDICFVALGAPKQEYFMSHYLDVTGIPASIGIGGSFDFVCGRTKRAPKWVQNSGFEWLWRLSMEPRRLWRRYLVDDLIFFHLFFNEIRTRVRGKILWFTR